MVCCRTCALRLRQGFCVARTGRSVANPPRWAPRSAARRSQRPAHSLDWHQDRLEQPSDPSRGEPRSGGSPRARDLWPFASRTPASSPCKADVPPISATAIVPVREILTAVSVAPVSSLRLHAARCDGVTHRRTLQITVALPDAERVADLDDARLNARPRRGSRGTSRSVPSRFRASCGRGSTIRAAFGWRDAAGGVPVVPRITAETE